jgi:hypothetical protein
VRADEQRAALERPGVAAGLEGCGEDAAELTVEEPLDP